MGFLDQVIGSVTGGRTDGSSKPEEEAAGMSPLTKALLVLLAAKAASHYFGKGEKPAESSATPTSPPAGGGQSIESGILAGLPSLDTLLGKLKTSGLGDHVESWIGKGENKAVAPADLDKALGSQTIAELQKETGMPREQLLDRLSGVLPQVIDKLTPGGTLPPVKDRGHW